MHTISVSNEKRIYSQNGEDGVIEHIFDVIGTTNKIAVEIGCTGTSKDEAGNYIATTIENNTANLHKKDWQLHWFDVVDPYITPKNTTFTNRFLTKDNIVESLEQLNIPKEFDLLSIDIDSNDYYLRDELRSYSPRVVIMEYNGCFDGVVEHIMPYKDNYVWPGHSDRHYGASLKSLVKQADKLGYDLVYCESQGVNAFFIRKDVNVFKTLTSEEAWVRLCWAKNMDSYNILSNLYRATLQRDIDPAGFASYIETDKLTVRHYLLESQEYRDINLQKLNKKSPQVSIPYTIISIDDRASENTKRTKRIMPSEFIDSIQFINAKEIDIESHFAKNNIKITWSENDWQRKPLLGELGVAASHINCLKYIVDNNIPELLVLEDDAILVDNFVDIFNNCYNDLPEDYDFLTSSEQLNLTDVYSDVTESVLINSEFICKPYLIDSLTKFMLYSYDGAKKILEAYERFGFHEPIDWFIFNLSRDKILNGYTTFFGNILVEHRNMHGSSIDENDIRGENLKINGLSPMRSYLNDGENLRHKIPNIIHQTWKSKTDIPENFSKWRDSFLELNPNFTFNLYDDDDNRALVNKLLPQLIPIYNRFPREIFRVDFVRAVYLFFYGGIYADMDVQCLKPLDRYLNLSGVYLGRMGTDESFKHSIPNAIMASSKNSGFWIFYIMSIIEKMENPDPQSGPEYVTGPVILRDSVLKYNSNIVLSKRKIREFISKFNLWVDRTMIDFSPVNIMESDIWYPLDWNNQEHQTIRKQVLSNEIFPDRHEASRMFPNSETVTYWTYTWQNG